MKKIIVLISGSGSNLQAIIDQIKLNNINASIECVISNKEDAYGLIRARESNINTQVIDHNNFESREDFDKRDDKNFMKHTLAWQSEGNVKIKYRDVHSKTLTNDVQYFPPKERIY